MPFSLTRQQWFLLLGDVALILLATYLSSYIRLGHTIATSHTLRGVSIFTLLLYVGMLYILDLYNLNRTFWSRGSALRTALAVVIAGFLAIFFFRFFSEGKYGKGIFLTQMMLVWFFLFGWRAIFTHVYPVSGNKEDVLIIGAGRSGTALLHLLEGDSSPYRIVGFLDDDPAKQAPLDSDSTDSTKIPNIAKAGCSAESSGNCYSAEQGKPASPAILGPTDRLMEIACQRGVKTVILAITHEVNSRLLETLTDCLEQGVQVVPMHVLYEQLTGRVPIDYVGDNWHEAILFQHLGTKALNQVVKRICDIVLASLGILCWTPAFPFIALAIYLDSPGPIFYSQERVGKEGRVFKAYKFRSMVPDAEKGDAVWAQKNDPRVTRVGRFLRKTHIDEFPQFINILKGEMSAVGPRAERPEFVKELEREIPFYHMRHAIKPGMAGWGLVKQGYGASKEDARVKLEYDLYYIKHQSLWLDIVILLKTIVDTLTLRGR